MRILVTDGSYKHTLGIVRELGRHGHACFVLCRARGSLGGSSRFCAGEVVVPDYNDPKFASRLLEALQRHRIDLVMPVGAQAFAALTAIQTEISSLARMVTVGPTSLALCLDKPKTYAHAEAIGIPVPKTCCPASQTEVPALAATMAYPCVIKARREMGKSVVVYARDPADLVRRYERVCATWGFRAPDDLPLIQEYVSGPGCGFFAVYDRGQCGLTFQHLRRREMPPSGGGSVAAVSLRHPQIAAYGKRLLDSLDWHGVAMVEFKLRSEVEPILMEINPKFWGSTELALAAGVSFPLALVAIAEGRGCAFSDQFRHPLRYHWPMNGDLLHAMLNPRALPAVLTDLFDPAVESNLWWQRDRPGTLAVVRRGLRDMARHLLAPLVPGRRG